jgi:hypothetical protein
MMTSETRPSRLTDSSGFVRVHAVPILVPVLADGQGPIGPRPLASLQRTKLVDISRVGVPKS